MKYPDTSCGAVPGASCLCRLASHIRHIRHHLRAMENIIRGLCIFPLIMAQDFNSLLNEKKVALFMVLAHLVMQSSGGGDVAPSQLNQVSCADSGAIIAE